MTACSSKFPIDRDTRGLVAPMAQEVLLVVDYPSGTVAEAARATSKAARAAYFYGYYDPAAIDELLRYPARTSVGWT